MLVPVDQNSTTGPLAKFHYAILLANQLAS